MKQLPIAARMYVGSVIAGGAVLLAAFFPLERFQHPVWFVTLLVLSSATSAFSMRMQPDETARPIGLGPVDGGRQTDQRVDPDPPQRLGLPAA